MQRFEQRLERSRGKRSRGPVRFVRLERRQALRLIDPLGFVGEQHRVTVERDADLVRMRIDEVRLEVDMRGRKTGR